MHRKIRPSQIGCGRPYLLTYVARLRTEKPEQAALISQYISRYHTAALALYKLVRRLFANPKNHLALYAIFLPPQAPEAVQRTWFWAENITGHPLDIKHRFDKPGRRWGDPSGTNAKLAVWSDLNVESTYALLVVLADPHVQAPPTRAARVWQRMIEEYGLSCSGLKLKSLEWIFRFISHIETRHQIGENVAWLVRSHLSSCELVRNKVQERQLVLRSLEEEHPVFFQHLLAYVEDMATWRMACRYLQDLRRRIRVELEAEGLNAEATSRVLWATQRAAMHTVANKIASCGRLQPPTPEELDLAAQHSAIVERFTAALIPEHRAPLPSDDVFRRFASSNAPPIRLAYDTDHLARILELYHQYVRPISEPLRAVLGQRKQFGRRTVHSGWEMLCRAIHRRLSDDPIVDGLEAKRLLAFVTETVRAWFQSRRPLRKPVWPENPSFWPTLRAGLDWEQCPDSKAASGNAVVVKLRIPSPSRVRKRFIVADLRGHLPIANVRSVDSLEIANGLSHFRPNKEILRSARNRPQKTFLKLQGMRLVQHGDMILARICATQMTQLLRPVGAIQNSGNILAGERVAVLHLYPGGRRLAQLVLFERCEAHPGWRQLPVEEVSPDTRAESYQIRGDRRVHIRTQRKHTSGFVVFDETLYFLKRARLESLSKKGSSEAGPQLATGPNGPKSNLGTIHFQQLAARIAKLCLFNRIGHLLVAGRGNLAALIKQPLRAKPLLFTAPSHKFFTTQQIGNHKQMEGFLIHALRKTGVTPLLVSSRARNFWVKPYIQEHNVEGCLPCRPYREDPLASDGRAYTGKRTLISPDASTPGYAYPLSACWAILLDWFQPEFSQHVQKTLSETVSILGLAAK